MSTPLSMNQDTGLQPHYIFHVKLHVNLKYHENNCTMLLLVLNYYTDFNALVSNYQRKLPMKVFKYTAVAEIFYQSTVGHHLATLQYWKEAWTPISGVTPFTAG